MTEKIIDECTICGIPMVLVQLNGAAHVFEKTEWQKIWGKRHPEHWKKPKKTAWY